MTPYTPVYQAYLGKILNCERYWCRLSAISTNWTQDLIISIDPLDRKLMQALSENGRSSHQQLSEHVARSPTAIARRQRQLEETGLIRGYSADIDLTKLGYGVVVHIKMTLSSQSRETLDAFENAIAQSPSVTQCDLMSGSDDYLVTVWVKSLDHFEHIHREELARLPGVVRMESNFVLRRVLDRRLPPGWID